MRFVIWIVAIAALGLGGAMLMAGPGAGMGFWDYGMSFKIFQTIAIPTLVAAGLSLLGGVIAFVTRRGGLGGFALFAAALAAAGGYVPIKMRALAQANPFIHDITTDFENPPQIFAAAGLDRKNPPDYLGDEMVGDTGKTVTASQMEAFPDLTPLLLSEDIEAATERARAAITSMGMEILAEGPAGEDSGAGWRIEAVETSQWFGFKDDFIVRLSNAENGETRVDVRSKSRVGGSDLGANAKRVRTFIEKMKAD